MYYGARYYDPTLGRFISADTQLAAPFSPQSLNRYTYVGNNPVRYTDPDGHCFPVCTAIIGAAIGGVVGAASVALPTMIDNYKAQRPLFQDVDPNKVGQAALGGALLGGALGAGVGVVAAAVGAGVGAAAVADVAVTAACADGDCKNEAQIAVQGTQRILQSVNPGQSVWSLSPFERGQAIEEAVGRSPQLVYNFPVIDRFENGVATSIKSLDLNANSYQNLANLSRTVTRYIDKIAAYQGQPNPWGGITILPSQITGRALQLIVPANGFSEAQWSELLKLQQYAQSVGVTLNLTTIQ